MSDNIELYRAHLVAQSAASAFLMAYAHAIDGSGGFWASATTHKALADFDKLAALVAEIRQPAAQDVEAVQ